MKTAIVVALLMVLSSATSCPRKVPHSRTGRPHVVILAVDSLRPDHVSALGYAKSTTPNIDRLIERGTTFSAISPLAALRTA